MRISDWSSDVCSSDLHYSPAFLALNPIGKYPVLIDGEGAAAGQPIFESCAILIYLAETYGPELLPKTGAARWEALEWLMAQAAWRSEERRVGKECVSTCRSRWSPSH